MYFVFHHLNLIPHLTYKGKLQKYKSQWWGDSHLNDNADVWFIKVWSKPPTPPPADQDGLPDDQAGSERDRDPTHWDHQAGEQHPRAPRHVCWHGHAGREPGREEVQANKHVNGNDVNFPTITCRISSFLFACQIELLNLELWSLNYTFWNVLVARLFATVPHVWL